MKVEEVYGGSLQGDTLTIRVTPDVMSSQTTGYRFPVSTLDAIVEDGRVAWIIFVDPNRGRYTSDIEDWVEHSVLYDDGWHLSQRNMTHG